MRWINQRLFKMIKIIIRSTCIHYSSLIKEIAVSSVHLKLTSECWRQQLSAKLMMPKLDNDDRHTNRSHYPCLRMRSHGVMTVGDKP